MCQCEIYETCPECRGTDRDAGLFLEEERELDQLRKEMSLNSLGDRPHNMGVAKLRRMLDLESRHKK